MDARGHQEHYFFFTNKHNNVQNILAILQSVNANYWEILENIITLLQIW